MKSENLADDSAVTMDTFKEGDTVRHKSGSNGVILSVFDLLGPTEYMLTEEQIEISLDELDFEEVGLVTPNQQDQQQQTSRFADSSEERISASTRHLLEQRSRLPGVYRYSEVRFPSIKMFFQRGRLVYFQKKTNITT